ncbi:MAG: hypothetical protein KC478_06535 [Bacteriovoracaceae bacterium]|nr:hypothetical protein [Bacteriovoracaceae bacterium]
MNVLLKLFIMVSMIGTSSVFAQYKPADPKDPGKPSKPSKPIKKGLCTKQAKAGLVACLAEVRSDLWTEIGICKNETTYTERSQCIASAKVEAIEENKTCYEILEKRVKICSKLGEAPYSPVIDPDNFVDPDDIGGAVAPNPYFPLVQGRSWTYKEGDDVIITVEVTNEKIEILGVECAVVRDLETEDGEVTEDTRDYYCQDVDGNVWYFGELSKEFEDGELVALSGSWKAGRDGAQPGILMKANPMVGDFYRQEFAFREAEDMGKVLSLTSSESTPAATCTGNCLKTKDFTPLEPDAIESKYYKPGVGLILEIDEESGDRVELINFNI